MADDEGCWYCNGINEFSCPVCAPETKLGKTERAQAIKSETTAVYGQDGWCLDEYEDPSKKKTPDTPEEYNLKLLVDAEEELQKGNAKKARELADRAVKNLEKHFNASQGFGPDDDLTNVKTAAPKSRPMVRRGEKEMLALAYAHVVRCYLLEQKYTEGIEKSKIFARIYEGVVNDGNPIRLHKQERKVLWAYKPGTSFLGHIAIVRAAMEIAVQARERVGQGFAPKTVMDHTQKAIDGIAPLDATVFHGLNSLRANLHVTRAHAALEQGRWEEAKQDAQLALDNDPKFREAEYMLQSAEDEEW